MPLTRLRTCIGTAALTAAHLTAAAAPLACKEPPSLADSALKAAVIVVGEVHGTAEVPAFVGQVVCSLLKRGRPVILALERDGAEQAALNRYLASAGLPADGRALLAERGWSSTRMQDGRSSVAMLQLVEQMRQWRQAGQPVGVLAMQTDFHEIAPLSDADKQSLDETAMARLSAINDRTMADKTWMNHVLHARYAVVALAGNYHTALGAKSRQRFERAPSFADVLDGYVPVHVIGVGTTGGQAWNLTQEGAGARAIGPGPMYLHDSRIDSRVDLGEMTASPPAVTVGAADKPPR